MSDEKNSFGFATPVYGKGMVVTATFPTYLECALAHRMEKRGRMEDAVSRILRFSDGRWREMGDAEQIAALHDEGETHMQDLCPRCIALFDYDEAARRVLEDGVKA
jgi:hypothetical protein